MKFRCSSLGKIMTEAKTIDPALVTDDVRRIMASKKRTEEEKAILERLKLYTLSDGAKSHIKRLAAEDIFGVDFTVTSKYLEKGIMCEAESLAMINRVKGWSLVKNTERRENKWLTGEADAIGPGWGLDVKTSWSVETFPLTAACAYDADYEWQMRGYMMLWDLPSWKVAYGLVDTPEELIRYENRDIHIIANRVPEYQRVTVFEVGRDHELEERIKIKCELASKYHREVLTGFDDEHRVV